jgi:serine/threonine-protein kinase
MTHELQSGSKLGKYEIHGRLSSGGMAELYLASLGGQGGFKKFVALKRVLPAIAQDEDFTRMFLDEARITASLSHAAIAQVYELAEDPQTREPVLAMEYIAGQNLEQLVKRARARNIEIPAGFTCRVAHDVLLALHSAHAFVDPATGRPMEIVHRDINPRNVMVTYTGGTKIVDFGIAKARGRLHHTHVGFVKGTLQYMAPEQVMAKTVDARTDLFSASILFYELLSGRRLFDVSSEAETMRRVACSDVPDLAEVAPGLPEELCDTVMKGLQCYPSDRWQTAREYARAIDRVFPDAFDDAQVAELMAKLFDDKIAVTRTMLSGTAATVADLQLISRRSDSDSQAPVVTSPDRPVRGPILTPRSFELTERSLEPVPVHSFQSLKKPRTPTWVYLVGALTALAGLVMLWALALLLLRPG